MNRIQFAAGAIIGVILCCAQALAAEYVFDSSGGNAVVEFNASYFGISYAKGRFNRFEGQFRYDENRPGQSAVQVIVDAGSVNSSNEKRNAYLRSGDFLDVANYPAITFNSASISRNDDGSFTVAGDLGLHGVTRPVMLTAGIADLDKSSGGDYRREFWGSVRVKASDFRLPRWAGKIEIRIMAEGIRQ